MWCAYTYRNGKYNGIFDRVHDIDPTDWSRPDRDAAWCKSEYGKMRSDISKVHSGYHQSGNQDAENEYDEWNKSCNMFKVGDHIVYSSVIISDEMREGLGKKASKANGMDSGVDGEEFTGSGSGETPDPTQKKKRKGQEALADALEASSENSMKSDAMKMLMEHGDEEEKQVGLDFAKEFLLQSSKKKKK